MADVGVANSCRRRDGCYASAQSGENRSVPPDPEALARSQIDQLLTLAGLVIRDVALADIHAARGVALREYPLPGFGFADHLLYVAGKAAGVIDVKKQGGTLTGVEVQSARYTKGLPASMRACHPERSVIECLTAP